MNGSTLLPWLFFGPLLISSAAYTVYTVTHWHAAAITAQISGAIVVIVILAAFAANLRRTGPPHEQDGS